MTERHPLTQEEARTLASLCAQIAVGADFDSWSFVFAPKLQLGEETMTPDVAGWRSGDGAGVPDWVCEIAPHGETKTYAKHGVTSVWRIDAQLRVIDVLQRGRAGWFCDTYDRRLAAAPFDGVEIDVPAIWAR
ncbi:MAG TPA: hypothetical protein VJ032_00980 [Thermoanaerobaculia bacterium]|nr:hypothetical protein [Thermoanaerobaculia bacterium]